MYYTVNLRKKQTHWNQSILERCLTLTLWRSVHWDAKASLCLYLCAMVTMGNLFVIEEFALLSNESISSFIKLSGRLPALIKDNQ